MRKISLISSVTPALVLISYSLPLRAEWTICNKTAEDKSVAIAYVSPHGGISVHGWWTLRACTSCAVVLATNGTTDPNNVFFRAEGKGSAGGDQQFCVSSESPFRSIQIQRCAALRR